MGKRKYSVRFFSEGLPSWKRRKDPFLIRYTYRPLSFIGSAFFSNLGLSANAVSYISIFIGLFAAYCYYFESHTMHILGAVLVNVWLLFDCIDGNIARCVKKQPFGVFADATACYILLAFLYTAIGYTVYIEGGAIFSEGNIWIIVVGSLISTSDIVMRLIFHKFREGEIELNKIIGKEETFLDNYKPHEPSLKDRLLEAINIGGYQPIIILVATIFKFLDIVLLGVLLIDVAGLCFFTTKNIIKATNLAKKYEKVYEEKWLDV